MRVGIGYDIHRLVAGRKFLLAGVSIDSPKGSLGHSDGDALFHAITDALLGAASLGDIGKYFPDTDPRWKGVSSVLFLKEAHRLVCEKGFQIENVDATIHLESPHLADSIASMKKNISEVLSLSEDRINLKAKRGEGLDAVGRGEAVAAQAIALLS